MVAESKAAKQVGVIGEMEKKMASEDGLTELEQKALDMVMKFPEGLPDEELDKILQMEHETRRDVMQSLINKGCIDFLESEKGALIYRFRSPEKRERYKELDPIEVLVYELLEEAGNKGLCVKELSMQMKQPAARINKLLGSMEKKGLIKFIKSIQSKKRKVWMLRELEPATEVSGGMWYQDATFNGELISVLRDRCLEYLEKQGRASRVEITLYLRRLGLVPAEFTDDHTQSILHTLYFDDKIEVVKTADTQVSDPFNRKKTANIVYRVKKQLKADIALLHTPCLYCPLSKECFPDGKINPQPCKYLTDWLSGPLP
jgi:DNA-directed RNA polymerase III subunit RPC6